MDYNKRDLRGGPLNYLGSYFADLVRGEEGLWDAQWERHSVLMLIL
jgi:hypothetical protein